MELNDYILLKIFKYLNSESLKSASQVNLRWNSVINSSSDLMNQIPLDFPLQYDFNLKNALKDSLHLKHRTMIIRSSLQHATDEQILTLHKIIENSAIDHLTLRYLPSNVEATILSKLTNITSLNMSPIFHNVFKMKIEGKFDFPNLKHVFTLNNSFLCVIGCHRIETLRICGICPKIFGFLETCNGLKDLTISGFREDGDREFTNFKLEKLRINTYNLSGSYQAYYRNGWDLSNCQRFLSSQRHSLKEIYIKNNCLHRFCSDKIMAYALNNMDLTTLHASHQIVHEKIYKVNRELKDLKIDFVESLQTKRLIECCPSVEKIDLTSAGSVLTFILPLVSKNMLNLKHLKLVIYKPPHTREIDAELLNLISLHVVLTSSKNVNILIMLIKCCLSLKYLILETPDAFKWEVEHFKEFLMLIEDVVEIRCKGDFGLTEEIFKCLTDMLEKSSLKLKTLKIEVDNPKMFEEMGILCKNSPFQFTAMQKLSEVY